MRVKFLFLFFSITVFFFSCNETNEPIEGVITGTVRTVMGTDSIGTANIMVYLLDAEAQIDTVTYNNQALFVDSVLTDSTGRYTFTIANTGKYAVYPQQTGGWLIQPEHADSSIIIDLKAGETVVVNFNREKSVMSSGFFKLHVHLKNLNKRSFFVVKDAVLLRRNWILFIPFMENLIPSSDEPDQNDIGNGLMNWHDAYSISNPYTTIIFTRDNYFEIYKYGSPIAGVTPEEHFSFNLPFVLPTSNVELTYDALTKEVSIAYK